MYDILGMDWCGTCVATRKRLTALDIPHSYTTLPPGEAGWRRVEELTGRRATPVILKNGVVMEWEDFRAEINGMNKTPRRLTQQELDEIE